MVLFLDPDTAEILQFLDPGTAEILQFLDPGTAEILQFLYPEIVKMDQKIARLKTVAKGKNFLTRIWKSNRVGIR